MNEAPGAGGRTASSVWAARRIGSGLWVSGGPGVVGQKRGLSGHQPGRGLPDTDSLLALRGASCAVTVAVRSGL